MIPFSTTDLDAFFDIDDFAETVTVNGTSVVAIFDDGFNPVNFANGQVVEGSMPKVTYKSSAVTPSHGQAVVARSVTYYISGIQNDGAGVTTLMLSRNTE